MPIFKISFLLIIAGWGFYSGGISAAFWLLVGYGILLFVWYALFDGVKAVDRYVKGPRQLDVTVYPGDTARGTEYPDVEGRAWRENPDPTRPDAEDWAGLITYKISKHERLDK